MVSAEIKEYTDFQSHVFSISFKDFFLVVSLYNYNLKDWFFFIVSLYNYNLIYSYNYQTCSISFMQHYLIF